MSSNLVRQTAIAAFNARLNSANTLLLNTQVAVGLDISGNYIADSNAKYINAVSSVREALQVVDTNLFSVATTYAPLEFVNSSIASLVSTAPEILDTLGEIATALGNDSQLSVTLNTQIVNEAARARLVEGQLRTDLSGEIVRALEAEGQLRTDLSGEIIRSLAADLQLRTDISGEIIRATAAEGVLSTILATEIENRVSSISSLSTDSDVRISDLSGALHLGLNNEIVRAQAAETTLTVALTNEISRATTTDVLLRTDLSGEIVRAIAAEEQLRTDLSGEILRATASESVLDSRTFSIELSYIRKDGVIPFTGNLNLNGNRIVNLATPVQDSDAGTKGYIDEKISALGSVFEYVGILPLTNLDELTKKQTGDYYRSASKQTLTYTDSNASTITLSVNEGDGILRNSQGGWDLIDNTDPTITGTVNKIEVSGNSTDGYTFDISPSYTGQESITTVGTVTSGVWNASTISTAYGGSGQTTYAVGDLLVGDSNSSLEKLPLGAAGTILRSEGGVPQWIVADTEHIPLANTSNFSGNSNVQLALDYLFNFTQIRKVAQHTRAPSTSYSNPDVPFEGLLAGKVNFINYDATNTSIYLPPASAGLVNGTVFRLVHNGDFTDGNLVVKYKDGSDVIQSVLELAPRDSIALVWNQESANYLFAVGI